MALIDPKDTPLDFPYGSMLTVHRTTGEEHYSPLGDLMAREESHQIGPCSIVDSHGEVNYENDGSAAWVGTISVQAPPDSDVTIHDTVVLPNGAKGIVTQPPQRPTNPFTGWTPFIKFRLATPGYTPAQGDLDTAKDNKLEPGDPYGL